MPFKKQIKVKADKEEFDVKEILDLQYRIKGKKRKLYYLIK